MCGRYALFGPVSTSRAALAEMDRLELNLDGLINAREPQYNIAPTQKAPVVAVGEEGAEMKALRWGLVPSWAKDEKIGARAINARAESVQDKPMFRAAFKQRRCLVPASGYFEWRVEAGGKQPYFIRQGDGELLMFAGLWEAWRPSDAGEWLRTFAIITGEPGKVSGDIHDRQPVILPPDRWDMWLTGTAQDGHAALRDLPNADLAYYAVPKAVGSPRNRGPELVQPLT